MNYDEMSDFEINKSVAKLEGFRIDKYKSEKNKKSINGFLYRQVKDLVGEDLKDYCNSWDDMGPIIAKNKITIDYYDDKGGFCHIGTNFFIDFDKNPLRAAAIVYLKHKASL